MSEMRIMTVRQPWAWAIIHGGKDVENRVRNIAGDYRGQVAIHVAQAIDTQAMTQPTEALKDAAALHARPHPDPLDGGPWFNNRGAIIGVVDLVDVHVVQQGPTGRNVCFDSTTPAGGICSQWAHAYDESPAYRGHHLVLANPRPLSESIPFKGALGLRRLNEAMVQRIEAAIA